MRELVVTVAVLFVSLPSMAVIPIRPTTTLAAETGNNTSAANSFAAQRNGNLNAGNVSKMPIRNLLYGGASSKIYAHFMPWFGPSNHMNVGYDSSDPAQVKRQVEDMISRGIDGALVDWYGPGNTHHNTTTINLMQESELHPGFEFAVVEDGGALKNAADPQQKLIDDLNYVYSTFEPSPAYMRRDGRPVILFFGVESYTIDWDAVRAAVLGNPLFIFRNSGAFTKPQTNGGYAWLSPQTTLTAGYMSLGYLDDFYSTALKYPLLETFGSGFKGFDDSLAAWGKNRKILQFCGQTWLSSMAEAGKYYNSSTQLENLQIVTWNDYEEGTEIETGVDNCFTVTASVTGSTLKWKITGNENTVDHYAIFISLDGKNLMSLVEIPAGNHSINLRSFDLSPATYTFHVKAVGKASILNHLSNGVTIPLAVDIAVRPSSLTVNQGQSGTLTVEVTPEASSFDLPVSLSCSGLPARSRCSFSPATVTPGGNAASSTLVISTTAAVSAKRPLGSSSNAPLYAFWFSGAGLVAAVFTGRAGRTVRRLALLAAFLVALAMMQVGCAGGSSHENASLSQATNLALKTGTFTVVVTGTSRSVQRSTTVTFVVK